MVSIKALRNEPESEEVLDLSSALAAEFKHLYNEPPADLGSAKDSSPRCDGAFCANVARNHLKKGTAALCFSGGGIRSASFCLGVAQALAKKGLFDKFKYLSTVSGGGYTGSMLSAWAYRSEQGLADVATGLASKNAIQNPDPVAWLRQYCNYLTPRRGVLSADTWTVIVTYVRNLLFNWAILIPFLIVVVSLPRLLPSIIDAVSAMRAPTAISRVWWTVLIVALVSLIASGYLLRRFTDTPDENYAGKIWSRAITGFMWTFSITFSTCWLLEAIAGLELKTSSIPAFSLNFVGLDRWLPLRWYWSANLGLIGLITGIAAASFYRAPTRRLAIGDRATIVVGHIAAGVLMGVGIQVWEGVFRLEGKPDDADLIRFFVLGPPALFLAIALGEGVFLGITSKISDDYHREWWSQLCGWLAKSGLVWIGLSSIAFAGPHLAGMVVDAGTYYVLLSPAAILALGAGLARFAFTQSAAGKLDSEKAKSTLSELVRPVLTAGGYAFVVLLLCFLAALVHYVTIPKSVSWPWDELIRRDVLPYSLDRILIVIFLALTVCIVSSVFVNINKFSLHAMYRDRLIRAFLGASRAAFPWIMTAVVKPDATWHEDRQFIERHGNSYTDFDRDDNPVFSWLSEHKNRKELPFLVINGALNLVRTKNLAWQERKAASYTFTPLHVGSDVTKYAPTSDYCGEVGGVTLGTAMAISGAAVSPNAGYHSTPIMTFLFTFFNARLGWWLGNPKHTKARKKPGPTTALKPLLNELLGKTDAESDWIYVSDGGHFDNLGIYEMVRRGCRWVVAVDSSADPGYHYDSLGIAIRKIQIDFGITVELVGSLRIGEKTFGEQGAHCSLFAIGYHRRLGGVNGRLLYIKASHYPRAPGSPVDVRQYASDAPTFPHESTADQFFGESQFESYRALGDWELDVITNPFPITNPYPTLTSIVDLFGVAQAHADRFESERKAEDPRSIPPRTRAKAVVGKFEL